jgi:hypothetical protein
VVPVPQPRFLHAVGDTMVAAVGPQRAGWLYRHRSFLDAGLRVPGSSDRPVAPGAPLLGMQSMVQRLSSGGSVIGEDERVSAYEALRAYTLDEAWASHDERTRGSVSPGKVADLAVLTDDPLRVDADRIGAIRVLATLLAGTPVHDTGLFAGRDLSPAPDHQTRGAHARATRPARRPERRRPLPRCTPRRTGAARTPAASPSPPSSARPWSGTTTSCSAPPPPWSSTGSSKARWIPRRRRWRPSPPSASASSPAPSGR